MGKQAKVIAGMVLVGGIAACNSLGGIPERPSRDLVITFLSAKSLNQQEEVKSMLCDASRMEFEKPLPPQTAWEIVKVTPTKDRDGIPLNEVTTSLKSPSGSEFKTFQVWESKEWKKSMTGSGTYCIFPTPG